MNYEYKDRKRLNRKSEIIKMLHEKKLEMSHHKSMKIFDVDVAQQNKKLSLSKNFMK